jgi:ribonuclease HI
MALLQCNSPKEMLHSIFQLGNSKAIHCVAFLWTWWKHRNKINAGEGRLNVEEVAIISRRCAADYELYYAIPPTQKMAIAQSWRPQEGDHLKINTDGSFYQSSLSGGWGFVMRNALGQVVMAAAGHIDHANNAMQTEATACLRAIQTAKELGINEVELESDALLLVQALTSSDFDREENGALFQEIRKLLSSSFTFLSISFCPRACNKVAKRYCEAWREAGAVSPDLLDWRRPEFRSFFCNQ